MTNFEDFWAVVTDVWQHGYMGIDISRLMTALGILLVFLILRQLFTRFIIANIKMWIKRTETDLDDELIHALEHPIRFIPVVMGMFFAIEYLALDGTFAAIGDNTVRSLIVFNIFWAFHRAVDPLSVLLHRLESILNAIMVAWLVKAIKITMILIGSASILEIWGIAVGPIIAGLGLFGVAVALGAQDLFKNLIAGILVIAERRYHNGDWIFVDGVVEGTVEGIGFRSTLVRRFDKAPVYVPNSKLADNAVTNFSAMTHRRIYWMIGVEYRTTVDQLRQVRDEIEAYVLGNDDFAKPPEVPTFVRIDRFSDSSIDIMLYCFTKTTNWGEWLAIKETLALEIKNIVERAGTGFAFPSQSVYVESLPADPAGDQPEAFVPPGTK